MANIFGKVGCLSIYFSEDEYRQFITQPDLLKRFPFLKKHQACYTQRNGKIIGRQLLLPDTELTPLTRVLSKMLKISKDIEKADQNIPIMEPAIVSRPLDSLNKRTAR